MADIGIGEIELNYDRREAVDLTYPHIIDHITFTSPPPKLYQTTIAEIQTIEDLANAQESGIRHPNIIQELANI
ncbi:unnamed protein product [Oppiella nova]|uniref:Uncharacterized protein n=1 Tax=Oppiella nova TaxID=334625 RepID=A0A7R9MED9_9ACAR|nr:unnamed protein product [Oppiella nova]CAG2175523.1 unnamed protein product [Oppiella nova]